MVPFTSCRAARFATGNDSLWRCSVSTLPLVFILATLLLTAACGHRHKKPHVPATPAPSARNGTRNSQQPSRSFQVGYTEQGTASWYGIPYHGRPAADGEIYNMETLVAAHRVMPFNTWLRVTNMQNQKSVEVRVIDRGPFVDGRIIDLSKAAARQVDLLGPGIGPVKLEVISAPTDIRSNDMYAVQVGAFTVLANADRVRTEYAARFGAAQVAVKQGNTALYRVLVGKAPSVADAQKLADQIAAAGQTGFVVRLDETVTGASQTSAPGITPQQP